jgi:hypothetical protein
MNKRLAFFAMVCAFFTAGFADAPASVQLGFFPKSYSAGEEVWVSFTVQNSAALPGAYSIALRYSSSRLTYVRSMAAQSGPFAISPSVHASGDTLTVAGFQGVQTDGAVQNIVLAVLVFKPASGAAIVDSASFGWISESVFLTDAKPLPLQMQVTGNATILTFNPSSSAIDFMHVRLQKGYLIFSTQTIEKVRLNLFSVSGKKIASFFNGAAIPAGTHALPLDARLSTGIYVVGIQTPHSTRTFKLGVTR